MNLVVPWALGFGQHSSFCPVQSPHVPPAPRSRQPPAPLTGGEAHEAPPGLSATHQQPLLQVVANVPHVGLVGLAVLCHQLSGLGTQGGSSEAESREVTFLRLLMAWNIIKSPFCVILRRVMVKCLKCHLLFVTGIYALGHLLTPPGIRDATARQTKEAQPSRPHPVSARDGEGHTGAQGKRTMSLGQRSVGLGLPRGGSPGTAQGNVSELLERGEGTGPGGW